MPEPRHLLLLFVALIAGTGCGEEDPTAESDDPEPAILSAYIGVVDILVPGPLSDVTGCDQEAGDEGMPIVLSLQVDASTLIPDAFETTTAAGETTGPSCATLAPADEPDELRTILLAGPMGTFDDRPASLTISGPLLAMDGTELSGLGTSTISMYEDGPELVLALLDPAATTCAGFGSTHEIQTTWQGGITGPNNSVPGEAELDGFSVVDAAGESHVPLAFDDLDDGDNHVVLCVPGGVEPARLEVQPDTLYDPTNHPNPETSADVIPR